MSADGAFPDEPDERSRLLAAGEGNAKPERKRALAFYLALSLIFLVQAGIAAAIAPTTAILESQICERYYGSSEASTQPVDCKVETVQSRLAMMRGVASMTSMIPGKPPRTTPFFTRSIAMRLPMNSVRLLIIAFSLVLRHLSGRSVRSPRRQIWPSPGHGTVRGGHPLDRDLLRSRL